MKKIIIISLAVIMAAVIFVGCSDKKDNTMNTTEKTTLSTTAKQTTTSKAKEDLSKAGNDVSRRADKVGDDVGEGVDDIADGVGGSVDKAGDAVKDGMKKNNAKSKIKPQLAAEANKGTNDFSQFRI